MNGVDHKDRDAADWTVSLKSSAGFLMVSCMQCTPQSKQMGATRPRTLGMSAFQQALGATQISNGPDLKSCGTSMDWSDIEDNDTKPVCVTSQDCKPCSSGQG
jgi:hypothetical protein